MPLTDPAGLLLAWCFHLSDAFWRCGVRHAFISPGSRSTPLTLALANYHGITCHSVLDERSATYMALGAGKQSGIPALFVCTSGTAVANAYPAVIEARMSSSPLIVLSADRPPAMRSIGASQTIDQIKIFGDYPLFYFDSGEPVNTTSDFKRLGLLAYQAFQSAAVQGGPVHLNFPFRKPLEPDADQVRNCVNHYCGDENSIANIQDSSGKTGFANVIPFIPPLSLSGELQPVPKSLHNLFAESKRPLVVAGPCFLSNNTSHSGEDSFADDNIPGSEGNRDKTRLDIQSEKSRDLSAIPSYSDFFKWCTLNKIPVLAETGGIPCSITHHPLLLQDDANVEALKPDLILRVGGSPIHQPTLRALQIWNSPQVTFGDHTNWPDITMTATHQIRGSVKDYDWFSFQLQIVNQESDNPVEMRSQTLKRKSQSPSFESYHDEWNRKNAISESNQRLNIDNEQSFCDGHVYAHLLPLLKSETDPQIIISNSFPIRDYTLFSSVRDASRYPVIVNRGASGIDGVTSTAAGAAIASGRSTVLFTGDLAFLHDITALNNLVTREISLKIVIINNKGGTIFRMLPFKNHDETYREFIETPQHVNISELAKAYGIVCETVDSREELETAWKRLAGHPLAILECRTDSASSMRLRNSL